MPEVPPNSQNSERKFANCIMLNDLRDGESGRVIGLKGRDEISQRLREMGFCESAVIQKIGGKHMVVCELCGVRVALSDRAAQGIEVEPIRTGI
jgi:ferrous iron transport protein A